MENQNEILYQLLTRIENKLDKFIIDGVNQVDPNSMDHVGGIELAMEVTGLAKPSIYGLIWRKEIPHYKKGKRLYFSKIELLNWIKSGRQKLRSEILNDFETEQVKAFRRRRYP